MNLKSLFFGQHDGRLVQIPRAILSSAGGSVLDYLTTIILIEIAGLSEFWGGSLGMVAGLIFVYTAGRLWIYPPVPGEAVKIDAFLFILISIIGAGINMLFLSLGLKYLKWHYLFVKLLVSAITFSWNFSMRRVVNIRLREKL
ncbi:MAG: GtrA family protein [Spirochaetales bacterium]|nr:GtrA family protein [Spirochaetales bacterium]